MGVLDGVDRLKPDKGTYVLVFENRSRQSLQVGKWGTLQLEPGYYLYVGSAFGPGGIRARVGRHNRHDKKKHWHIDYVRSEMTLVSAWCNYSADHYEHEWATGLQGMNTMEPITGFGCTDCQCITHLYKSKRKPVVDEFSALTSTSVERVNFT